MATLGLQLAPDAAQAYEGFPVKPQREGQVLPCGCARHCNVEVDTKSLLCHICNIFEFNKAAVSLVLPVFNLILILNSMLGQCFCMHAWVRAATNTNADLLQIAMRTLKDSELIISFFPKFTYDARGGGGLSDAPVTSDGRTAVKFDLQTLNIPAVSYKTASFLGVPMLPGVKIAIEPSMLEVSHLLALAAQAELTFRDQPLSSSSAGVGESQHWRSPTSIQCPI